MAFLDSGLNSGIWKMAFLDSGLNSGIWKMVFLDSGLNSGIFGAIFRGSGSGNLPLPLSKNSGSGIHKCDFLNSGN